MKLAETEQPGVGENEEAKPERHPARAKIAGASGVAPTILRIDGVMARTGLAKSTIYLKLQENSSFPKPIKLGGPRAQGWLASEVDEWISEQVRASRGVAA